MILRLVFSFFFFSLVTGNRRSKDLVETATMGDCQNMVCTCQDQTDTNNGLLDPSPLNSAPDLQELTQNTEPTVQMDESHYGYPAHGLISANPVRSINAQSRIEAYESGENPNLQEPRPVQYPRQEESEYSEKTLCFTPSMLHKLIKAALEYVSQMPSDIKNIVAQLDQELNKMSDSQGYLEEDVVKKPLYPLDSKTIFQMVDKPKSQSRTNLILKYELPNVEEPYCREALEKLVEIAYTAYMQLEEHPQCREYLYNFATHQPENRPTGHLGQSPGLKSLIASILDQVDKHKSKLNITPDQDRYGDLKNPEIPQTHEYTPQKPEMVEYNINEYSVPEGQDYNMPEVQEYNVNEYNVPNAHEMVKPVMTLPKDHEYDTNNEYSITKNHEYNGPEVKEYTITENREYEIPIHEYSITKNHEYNVPEINEFTITQSHEYNVPKVQEYSISQSHEYNIPQNQDIVLPQVQSIKMPEVHETVHETVEEVVPMKPEETINILTKILKNSDRTDSENFVDHLMDTVLENQSNFHPKVLKLLVALLNAHKKKNINRFNDIFLLLLDLQRKRDWPWNDGITQKLLSNLVPDNTGHQDSRIIEIILDLYKKRPNEKHIENILSLLKPIKEGNLEPRIRDILLRLIHSNQNNLLHPDHVDILLKLLKPSRNGNGKTIDVDVTDLLSRWSEIGVTPTQLKGIFGLLKPYVNGHSDKRPIDITHFLLTKGRQLNPKYLDFILSFLYPENGVLDTRRIDIIHFLLKNVTRSAKQANILLTLLQENAPGVLNSTFSEILLFLDSHKLLTPELIETIINLLTNEVTGKLDENQGKTLFFRLAPLKQSNPKLLADVLTLLSQGGLYGKIVDWFKNTNDLALPNRDSTPQNIKVIDEASKDQSNEYRIPDGGYQSQDVEYQSPEHDFKSIFKWLDSQGLITQDQESNTDLVNKILKILQEGERELGVVELTYMLKHEKPLIYQPVYYVKYRLPILSFISNMKSLLQENPHLNTDPMKLLQELIVVSNVTEVSPNLQGYPKEEILKLTFNDGDLVQAKILDEQNLSLNDQISYVHGLNSDISPEEILQLNRMNEAKYFPKLKEVKGVHPDKLTMKDVDRFIDIPPVHYKQLEMNPKVVGPQTKMIQQYVSRQNQK